jgi:hypothetical protein
MRVRAMLSTSARKAISAALARPSVGGVAREILRAPSCVVAGAGVNAYVERATVGGGAQGEAHA